MSEFSTLYKMLRALRGALDSDEFPAELLTPETLGVSKAHLDSLWAMLSEQGYVSGVKVTTFKGGRSVLLVAPRITIPGLQFMEENSMMRKAADALRGVVDVASRVV